MEPCKQQQQPQQQFWKSVNDICAFGNAKEFEAARQCYHSTT